MDPNVEQEDVSSVRNGVVDENVVGSTSKPVVGMTYKSWVEIEILFKRYGKEMGFGISRVAGVVNCKKERRAMMWRCECWGSPTMRLDRERRKIAKEMGVGGSTVTERPRLRTRKSKKCDCDAKVYASVNAEDLWEVRIVNLEHKNHKPVPSDARLVKEYRMGSFTSNLRKRVINDSEADVPVHQIHDCLARERDGVANMPITVQDMRHVVNVARRKKLKGGDAEALMAYLGRMRRDNNQFYHSVRSDVGGGLQDVFWVDARSKAAYEEFGDVVCFDTTYMTNDYELPFANFVGVNHHGQTTLFGCALISHEDCETFHWVFQQWLMCIGGVAPRAILTDQAAAMRRPIAELMPSTTHRWCIWHILQKLPLKLGGLEKYESLKKKLKKVIYNSFTPAEFEENWAQCLEHFELTNNDWLNYLFLERGMWVPAFMRNRFWAGMRTTQRVESIHSFFDKFVKASTKLVEFGEKYIAAVEKRMCQERDADDRDRKWQREVATGFVLEKYFSEIYTDEKFLEHQRQCQRMNHGFVSEEVKEDDENVVYVIDDFVWVFKEGCRSDVLTNMRRFYRVMFNTSTQIAKCNCGMFETHGIMCCHIVRVLFQNKITVPPALYVLDRWKKKIPRKHQRITVAYHDPSRTTEVRRIDRMQIRFDLVLHEACLGEVRTVEVLNTLDNLLEAVGKLPKEDKDDENTEMGGKRVGESVSGAGTPNSLTCSPAPQSSQNVDGDVLGSPQGSVTNLNTPTQPSQTQSNFVITQTLRDPVVHKKRDRPRGSRLKSEAEKAITKARNSKSNKKGKKKCNIQPEQKTETETETEEECGHQPSKPSNNIKLTRATAKKGRTSKRRSVCLQNLYDEDHLIRTNNVRLRSLDDSSDDNSESF